LENERKGIMIYAGGKETLTFPSFPTNGVPYPLFFSFIGCRANQWANITKKILMNYQKNL
jgi:hypothetical protein